LSGPGINIKTDYLLAVNGVPLNTEKSVFLFCKNSRKTNCTFCKQYPILKDAKEFTVVSVSSEVNLRQDW
jgi:hypothetical protein